MSESLFKKSVVFAFIAIFISACRQDVKVARHDTSDFFDLKSFVDQKIEEYKSKNCSLYKMGDIDGENAQTAVPKSDIEWEKELKILSAMDINKSSWYDYFKIDTLTYLDEDSTELTEIKYSTNSNKIPIKSLKLLYYSEDMSEPFWIEAERKSKNWIFNTEQKVMYAQAGLKAEGYQKILWM